MESDEIVLGGALESNFEYDYAGGIVDVPQPLHRFEDRRDAFNQAAVDHQGCTWYAAMTCLANNRGIDRAAKDREYMRKTAPSYGWTKESGMYLSKAKDMVLDYLNKLYPDQGRTSLVVSPNDPSIMDFLKMGYLIHIGSFVDPEYTKQIKTGKISSPWGNTGEGHSRSIFTSQSTVLQYIEENYLGVLPYNTIEIDCWADLQKVHQFFLQGFIYYPTHKMTPEITIPHNEGSTPSQQEIVKAREKIIQEGRKPLLTNYTDEYYINKMIGEIIFHRAIQNGVVKSS